MAAPEKWRVMVDGRTFIYLDEFSAVHAAKAARAEGRVVGVKPPDSERERFIATYTKDGQGIDAFLSKTPEPKLTSPAPRGSPAHADRRARRPGRGLIWWGRIQRAVSIRIGCGSLIAGFVFGVIAGQIFGVGVGAPVTIAVAAIIWLVAVFNDGQTLNCPRCKKMVKLGASVCSHCGASLV
jgi:hypothetical protein